MKFLPARVRVFLLFIIPLFILFLLTPTAGLFTKSHVYADAPVVPTLNPNTAPKLGQGASAAQWEFDPTVTEVGKNAERARQLVWWVFSHPAVHTAPVIATIWGFSRNLVYVFVILVIVAFGVGFILSNRNGPFGRVFSGISSPVSGIFPPTVIIRILTILLYVTFSYVLILVMIQVSEILMRFFIENVGGRDLFNVIFSGSGNSDVNYTGFVGYRDVNPINQEMVNTSLFLVRLTSLTYYTMAVILILRSVILWFLLIISPFLALLMPFIFIRNIGWIWIGVFFQWLFYGPLMALFLASLTKIWISGIPFAFNFKGWVNCLGPGSPTPDCIGNGEVYRTAINILYGGPAQTLSAGNSANYIDTYAEYVIALVMLWACIILPWLLLRIFRDYCCEAIMAANSTLNAIFDRIRQIPPPPPPPVAGPVSTAGMARDLPFRQKVEERVQQAQKQAISQLHDISSANTSELARAFDMSVSSLQDVSRLEMDKLSSDRVRQNLQKISQPVSIASTAERERFVTLKKELQSRAVKGDRAAQSLLSASTDKKEVLISKFSSMQGQAAMATPMARAGVYAPTVTSSMMSSVTNQSFAQITSSSQNISQISRQTKVNESKVKQVLGMIPTAGTLTEKSVVSNIAQQAGLSEIAVKGILQTSQTIAKQKQKSFVPVKVAGVDVVTQVSVEDYEDVKKMWTKHYREVPVHTTETIHNREEWLDFDIKRLTNISDMLASSDAKLKQKGLEEVSEILPFMLLGGFSDVETITYLKAKLEAAKQVKTEQEIEIKVRKEVSQEVEEDTLIEAVTKQKTESKAEQRSASMNIDTKIESETASVPDRLMTSGLIANTSDIIKRLDMIITRLSDISKLEMDISRRNAILTELQYMANPDEIDNPEKRDYYLNLKKDLTDRTDKGDQLAKIILAVAENKKEKLATIIPIGGMKETGQPQKPYSHVSVQIGDQLVSAGVSVEDYEDVKKMWTKHYREVPVHTTETIHNREEWLDFDIKRLTNISDMLASSDAKLKQKGLEEVSEILPFMLLGGFSDVETITYLKAKLEAAKQVKTEQEIEIKAKSVAKAEIAEEQDTLYTVVGKKDEEKKMRVLSDKHTLDIPSDQPSSSSKSGEIEPDNNKSPDDNLEKNKKN